MIKANIQQIYANIEDSCVKAGRKSPEVKLIAVSKNVGLGDINEAISLGLKDFGENKAQELNDKSVLLPPVTWHFIGHLQTNKVKYAVDKAEYIHAVDSVKLAEEIDKQAGKRNKTQNVLIEANVSGEDSKHGVRNEDDIFKLAEYCSKSGNLKLIGLMTMAPFTEDEHIIRNCFSGLRKIKEKLNSRGFALTELSMGMTGDYRIAVEEGSTMVRIGSGIFGERDYTKSWKEL